MRKSSSMVEIKKPLKLPSIHKFPHSKSVERLSLVIGEVNLTRNNPMRTEKAAVKMMKRFSMP
jgi:hypothetical protein